jgi:predicted lipoprotein with Yx(FWY)xxD motif
MNTTRWLTGAAVAAAIGGSVVPAAYAASGGTAVGTKHGNGHTVLEVGGHYAYTHITASGHEAACNASCLKVWPVVSSVAKPRARDGVKVGKLARNSHHQVTYYGHRLYFFDYDIAGLPAGDNITSFGGVWRLINVKGKAA